MFYKVLKLIGSFWFVPLPEKFRTEFKTETIAMNVSRVKTTAVTFIILEAIIIAATIIFKKESALEPPRVYYLSMYVLLIIAMIVFLSVFSVLKKNISANGRVLAWGIAFSAFILLWCAGISLLDQKSSGQIIVYAIAVIAVSVVPVFEPVVLSAIYLSVQVVFLILLPSFNQTGVMPFGNTFNSTLIIILSVIISRMRYQSLIRDFINKKTIQEKNEELVRVNRELEVLSRTDALTGVFNRLVFDKSIHLEWNRCKRHAIPLSLLMIDADFFKKFNDNYGHQAGDEGIRLIAKILAASAKRSADVVTRYGGDEFAVILPHMNKEAALELARQIRDRVLGLKIPNAYSTCSEYLTVSIGVHSIIPHDEISVNDFIRNTDIALYEAKKERNAILAQ